MPVNQICDVFLSRPNNSIARIPHLGGEEAKHMLQVLRMRVGDRVILFDNSSQEYQARIRSISGETRSILSFRPTDRGQGIPAPDVAWVFP